MILVDTYLDLFQKVTHDAYKFWNLENESKISTHSQSSSDLQLYSGYIELFDLLIVAVLAIIFTLARVVLEKYFSYPLAQKLLGPENENVNKFGEALFKLSFYSLVWLWCVQILYENGKFKFWYDSSSVWEGWSLEKQIESNIYWYYMIQLGFYFHSLYATVYLDEKRKDTLVMLFHHVVTIILITFSYAIRYHYIGVLVLFHHDISDIFLEFTKLNDYIKLRKGVLYTLPDTLVIIGFIGFAVSWAVFRLYWFPTCVLMSTGHFVFAHIPSPPFYFLFNGMLWVLQVLHIWWFHFIIKAIIRVVLGDKKVSDEREYEEKTQSETTMKKKNK